MRETFVPSGNHWLGSSFGLQQPVQDQETILCVYSYMLSHVPLFATPWTVARQAPLSVGFPRQEYWSGLPFPPQGDLPDPGIKPVSLMSPALAGRFFSTSAIWGAEETILVDFNPLLLQVIGTHLEKSGA